MKKQMLMIAFAGLGLLATATPPSKKADGTFKVDVNASTFKWHVTKVTGEHNGIVKFSKGTMKVVDNALMGAEIVVDMNTIDDKDLSGEYHDKLNNHLKSDDFFAVQKFATATIKMKSAAPIAPTAASANNYFITADLTIKGITNEISFPALVVVSEKEVVINADLIVNRAKYDVRYGSTSFYQGLGDKAISDEFDIKVRVVGHK